MSRKQSVKCYRCGRRKHLKRYCRARLRVPRKSTKQRLHRYLKGAGTRGKGFAGENKVTSEVKIRNFIRGSSSTVPGKINGTPAAIIIDTSAEVSIVRKGFVRAEDVDLYPKRSD